MSLAMLAVLQTPPPEGLLLAMALWYALGFMGMILAWHNYRKRKGAKESDRDRQTTSPTDRDKPEMHR